jgi:hypothetical protein
MAPASSPRTGAVSLGHSAFLAKGLFLLLLTPEALSRSVALMRYGEHYYFYLVPSLVIGLYLTWAGFNAHR